MKITTRSDTSNWSFGQALLGSVCSVSPLLTPQFIGHVRMNVPFESIDACEPVWAEKFEYRVNGSLYEPFDIFQWRRTRKVQSTAMVRHTITNKFGDIVPGSLYFDARWSEEIDWIGLFKSISDNWSAQLGLLHIYTDAEEPFMERLLNFRHGGFGAALHPSIQQFGWAMALGDEFANKVDPDRIAAAGYPVYRISSGYVFTITNNIADVVEDLAGFMKRRSLLRAMFPRDFFALENDLGPFPAD